jgi:beta-lysine 5,6-aminomutase beta subunit
MDVDLKNITPYGDTMGDGAVQLSFTLPLENGSIATQTAKQLVLKMGFSSAEVVNAVDIGQGFTFFIVYGKTSVTIDSSVIKPVEVTSKVWSRDKCSQKISEIFERKLVIVGACIGEDAHTVGIDAIMNMKGYAGHYGLERYPMIESFNMGAQVEPEELLRKAVQENADAILVSQVVTQKEIHLRNFTKLIELVEAEGLREKVVLIAGGPRIDNKTAMELGYDAGFGRGSFAENVASFVIQNLEKREMNN